MSENNVAIDRTGDALLAYLEIRGLIDARWDEAAEAWTRCAYEIAADDHDGGDDGGDGGGEG